MKAQTNCILFKQHYPFISKSQSCVTIAAPITLKICLFWSYLLVVSVASISRSLRQKQEIDTNQPVGRLTNHSITHRLIHRNGREVKVDETWFICQTGKANLAHKLSRDERHSSTLPKAAGKGGGLHGRREPHHHELCRPAYDRGLQSYEGGCHNKIAHSLLFGPELKSELWCIYSCIDV